MIKDIYIDGFRSLIDFRLSLNPGLNILVGSNGTGKSNFITFLDFMGSLLNEGLNSAIGIAQGASAVFSRENFNDNEAKLVFQVKGAWNIADIENSRAYYFSNDQSTSGVYEYTCELKYIRSLTSVHISKEKIVTLNSSGRGFKLARESVFSDFDIKCRFTDIEMDQESKELFRKWRRRSSDEKEIISDLNEELSPNLSFFGLFSSEDIGLNRAANDLVSYQSVNIDPTVARRSTPVGSISSLERTGEGLAGTLYQIREGKFYGNISRLRRFDHFFGRRDVQFESIISWCREVNPAIDTINVELDFMEAQFKPSIGFQFGDKQEIFSLKRASDGTVKWLALVTILLSDPTLNIIEEPENFLHPTMQESFINLCRRAIEVEPNRTVILSTHSPTLIDFCSPTEIIMFQLHNGRSVAEPVSNWEELEKKIEQSRFGLGHYFRMGALYGKNSSNG